MIERLTSVIVGFRLRLVRQACGLSQSTLASFMLARGHRTWNHTTVSRTETGKRSISLVEAVDLADALDISLGALIGREPLPQNLERVFAYHERPA